MSQSETVDALKRAGKRAAFHLIRAAVESLKAVEVVIDELSRMGSDDDDPDEEPRRVRIEIE